MAFYVFIVLVSLISFSSNGFSFELSEIVFEAIESKSLFY